MGRRLASAGRRTEKSWVASARTRAQAHARAHASFEGIHGRAGRSGVAVTASETALNFSGRPKWSITMPFSPVGFQFRSNFTQAPKDPIIARCVVGSQFAQHFSNFVIYAIRSGMRQMVSPLQ